MYYQFLTNPLVLLFFFKIKKDNNVDYVQLS